MPPRRTDVNVSIGGPHRDDQIQLKSVPVPLNYDDLCDRLREHGLTMPMKDPGAQRPDALLVLPEEYQLTVGDSPSEFSACVGGTINMDQPLIQYYHEVFLHSTRTADCDHSNASSEVSEASIEADGSAVNVGDVRLSFRRTVRVPDNAKSHALPPDLGPFSIYNSASYLSCLPEPMLDKGGAFIAMYQREAMWISFKNSQALSSDYAVKVSVGGVNALTGKPQNETSAGKQDYLAIKKTGGQLWLDGISTAPGVVKQFVAMPLGQGYTVEGQVTGKEAVGGLQIDVFPAYSSTVEFRCGPSKLNLYKTPRQMGLAPGSVVTMADRQPSNMKWRLLAPNNMLMSVSAPVVNVIAYPTYHFGSGILVRLGFTGTADVPFPESNEVSTLREKLRANAQWGEPVFNGQQLEDGKLLSDYGILPGCVVDIPVEPSREYRRGAAMSHGTISFGSSAGAAPGYALFGAAPSSGVAIQHAAAPAAYGSFGGFGSSASQIGGGTTFGAFGSSAGMVGGLFGSSAGREGMGRERERERLPPSGGSGAFRARGKAPASAVSGLAAGGTISQKVVRDTLPPTAYDLDRGTRLHVAIVNAPHFPLITGLPAPASPVSARMYLDMKLPWYAPYEEHVPHANNAAPGGALASVKSVAEMDKHRAQTGHGLTQAECGYCAYEMATVTLQPCGHAFCDGCLAGVGTHACPSCRGFVTRRTQFAAAMPVAGNEEHLGVQAARLILGLYICGIGTDMATFYSSFFSSGLLAPQPSSGPTTPRAATVVLDDTTPTAATFPDQSQPPDADARPRLRRRRSSLTVQASPLTPLKSSTSMRNAASSFQRQSLLTTRARSGSDVSVMASSYGSTGAAEEPSNQKSGILGRLRSGSIGTALKSRRTLRRAAPPPPPPPSAPLPSVPLSIPPTSPRRPLVRRAQTVNNVQRSPSTSPSVSMRLDEDSDFDRAVPSSPECARGGPGKVREYRDYPSPLYDPKAGFWMDEDMKEN
ncbi:hypothetical protein OBBRIDRAFT_839456 [Obba rivulosa]|uniref:RING-type domain-containing protein n=1 Tax=Obba rivulosa TaxID=1052685 RepID=A0A8E2DGF9_9APHY|nr:hypothetical protein OBBRIDRAFT_839456 [Obba rivulosa]